MIPQRARIRHAVKAALFNTTEAGERVAATRYVSWRPHQLPALAIYTLEEDIDPSSEDMAPRDLIRDLSLVIEAWAKPGEGVDDAMDLLSSQIESALHADPTFGGLVKDSILDSTTMDVSVGGDMTVGLVRLFYRVTYVTDAPEATDVADFNRATATHRFVGVPPDAVPSDGPFNVRTDP